MIQLGFNDAKQHCSVVFLEHCLDPRYPPSCPPSLNVIMKFASKIMALLAIDKSVTLYARRQCLTTASAALLVGSFLILTHDMQVDDVIGRLSTLACASTEFGGGITLRGCLTAIRLSKSLGLLKSVKDLEVTKMKMRIKSETMPHTSMQMDDADSLYQIIVPGRLLLASSHRTQQTSSRHTLGCHAAACARLGVCLVLRVRERPAAGPDHFAIGFAARGIAVEDLPLGPGCLHMLRALDTLLAILRSAPGPVAVHADAAGLRAAEPLLAACLVTACGFAPGSAAAWLRMAHPAAGIAAGRPGRCSTPGPAEWAGVGGCAAGRLRVS